MHLFLLLPHVLIGLSHTIHFTPSSSLHTIPLVIFLTLLTATPPAYPQHWAYHMTYLPSLSMPNCFLILVSTFTHDYAQMPTTAWYSEPRPNHQPVPVPHPALL